MSIPRPVLLLILDGWGYSEEAEHNAIAAAECPNWRELWANRPRSLIRTDGLAVGLPEGQMGNSEVGHMNLGAGRIVYQDLSRVDAALADGSFQENAVLMQAMDGAAASGTLHVIGLVSPGGVHSHEKHIHAALRMASKRGLQRVAVHAILDGRDMPPRSAKPSLESLMAVCAETGAKVASVCGRYYAMDRDQRWDRQARAFAAIAGAQSDLIATDAVAALDAGYGRDENDEFVLPTVISGAQPIADGDTVLFMNFRADRARQLTRCFVEANFDGFERTHLPKLKRFVTLTEYAADLPVDVAFPAQDLMQTLPEVIAERGMKQLRIAETEKYAHVSFFFSGGREKRARQLLLLRRSRKALCRRRPGAGAVAKGGYLRSAARNELPGSNRSPSGSHCRREVRFDRLQSGQSRHGRPYRHDRGGHQGGRCGRYGGRALGRRSREGRRGDVDQRRSRQP